MTLDQLARLTLTAALLLSVPACALAEEPDAVGNCELVIRDSRGATLKPPYQTTMYRANGREEATLNLSGTGWGMTQVDFAGPGRSGAMAMDMGGEFYSGVTATAPGTWHLRLTSGPCTRTVEIEVMPVP